MPHLVEIELDREQLDKITRAAEQCKMSPEDFALWAAVSRAEAWLDQP